MIKAVDVLRRYPIARKRRVDHPAALEKINARLAQGNQNLWSPPASSERTAGNLDQTVGAEELRSPAQSIGVPPEQYCQVPDGQYTVLGDRNENLLIRAVELKRHAWSRRTLCATTSGASNTKSG